MGQDSAEDRLKDMLHALRQLEGSDVLVLQDQMDATCGVVMQTKVQKLMFERWGETLAMDFTHGTNNLGYHLGTYALVQMATLIHCCSNIGSNYSNSINGIATLLIYTVYSCFVMRMLFREPGRHYGNGQRLSCC
jgi:hypothetical protein